MQETGSGWRLGRRWFAVVPLVLVLLAVGTAFARVQSHDFPEDPGLLRKVGVVLSPRAVGAWAGDAVESPSVVRDPDTGTFAMMFVGYGTRDGAQHAQIGLTHSRDGIHWQTPARPVFGGSGVPGSSDEAGATGPVLVRDGAGWVMFYIGLTQTGYEGGGKTINYATARHLQGPWERHGVLITPSGDGWRAKAVWHPSVVREGGRWVMFFNATGADGQERIGYAVADRLAGPWLVDDANSPVLDVRPGAWDADKVADPFVRRVGDHWVMDYYGYNREADRAGDGEAVTSADDFPLGWRRTHLVIAPSEPYDAKYAHKPWIVTSDGRLFHYYTAVGDDGVRRIALAISGRQPR